MNRDHNKNTDHGDEHQDVLNHGLPGVASDSAEQHRERKHQESNEIRRGLIKGVLANHPHHGSQSFNVEIKVGTWKDGWSTVG